VIAELRFDLSYTVKVYNRLRFVEVVPSRRCTYIIDVRQDLGIVTHNR
jgi:hypothetical protein